MSFPTPTSNGELYTINGYTYQWFADQSIWKIVSKSSTISNATINNATINVSSFAGEATFNANVFVNSSVITVGDTSVNVSINSTSFSGTSNNSSYLGGNSVSTILTYANNKAANAYSNAVTYADLAAANAYSNAISYAGTSATTNAAQAYSNAVTYADLAASNAYSNSVTYTNNKAANAYSNAVTYAGLAASNAYSNAVAYAGNLASNAYSNAVTYTDNKAANAYSNSVTYTNNKAANAYSNAVTYADLAADNAYSNAITYSSTYANNKAANAYANANYNAGLYADNAYSNAVSYTSTYYAAKAGATFTGNVVLSNTGLIANGSIGTDKQVLISNGSSPYWAALSPVRQNFTANGTGSTYTVSGGYTPYNLDVFVNGVKLLNGTDTDVSNGSIFTTASVYPSGTIIDVLGQVPYTGAPGSYVAKAGDTMSGPLHVGTTTISTNFISTDFVNSSIIPVSNLVFTLGTTTNRFAEMWVGSNSIYFTDTLNGPDQKLSLANQVFYIAEANTPNTYNANAGFNAGGVILQNFSITLANTTQNLIIGKVGDTGNTIINRATQVGNGSVFSTINATSTTTNTVYTNYISANGTTGLAGQVLVSGDGSSNVYWANPSLYYVLGANTTYAPGNATPSSVFGVGATLTANIRYQFRAQFSISASVNNILPNLAWNGTAISYIKQLSYYAIIDPNDFGTEHDGSKSNILTNLLYSGFTTGVDLLKGGPGGTLPSNTPLSILLTGVVDVGNTGGTFYPTIGWDKTPGTITRYGLSSISFTPAGVSSANSSVGTWV